MTSTNNFSLLECAKLMLATRKWNQDGNAQAQNYCRQRIFALYQLQSYEHVNPMWIFAVLEIYQLTREPKYRLFARQLLKSMPIFKNKSKNYLLLAATYAKCFQLVGDERLLKLAKRNFNIAKHNDNKNILYLMWVCLQLYEASFEEEYIVELIELTNQHIGVAKMLGEQSRFEYFLTSLTLSMVYGKTLDQKYLNQIENCPFLSLIKPSSLIIFSLRAPKDKRKALNIAHGKFCPCIAMVFRMQSCVYEQTSDLPNLNNYPVLMGKNTYYYLTSRSCCNHTHDLFDIYDLL